MNIKTRFGILGGMGPAATNYCCDEILAHTAADTDQEHLSTVVVNHTTLPDRTRAILYGEDQELLEAIRRDMAIFEIADVGCIGITCNTSHYFYDQFQSMTKIPIIHMPRESVLYARKMGNVKKIGILGTDGTIQAGVYKKECDALGLETLVPGPSGQKDIMSLIYDDIKAGREADTKKFLRPCQELIDAGADAIILACTELSVYKKNHEVPALCIDAMDVLVREAILRSGYNYK